MVHSHLMYCLSIYSCANMTSLNKVEIMQKKAIRIICNSGYRDHTAPLFARLGILPFDRLIKLSILKFMHSFIHNRLPISFARMWIFNRERFAERELRNADQLYVPPHRFATLKRMPLFNFPVVWNAEGLDKFNPIPHRYVKNLKNMLRV